MFTISVLAVSAAVMSLLIGFSRSVHRNRREKAESLRRPEHSQVPSKEEFVRATSEALHAPTHHEMRQAVDAFPLLRSSLILSSLKNAFQAVPPDYRTALIYKLRWIHENYPGLSETMCERNRQLGKRQLFPSIRVSLSAAGVPKGVLSERASEVEGGFLAADSLETMRVAATHYTLLLLPGLQGGIDSTIEHDLMGSERAQCFRRLKYLQELREEIEQRPLEA